MKQLVSLMLLTSCLVAPASADDSDPINLVALPKVMQEHMLANMRDHLLAVAQIQEALAEGRFETAAEIAEQRIGMSSLASHGAAHMAPYMPKPMQVIGTEMHRAASQFAIVAQDASVDRDLARALKSLSAVTERCIACHAEYRIR